MNDSELTQPRPRRVFLECTQTLLSGLTTGIQRVVRSIVNHSRDVGDDLGLECVPIIYDELRHQFLTVDRIPEPVEHRLEPKPCDYQPGAPPQMRSGDLLLLVDSSWTIDFWPQVERLKRRGVVVGAVYYDMLPLEHPEWFFEFLITAYTKYWNRVRSTASFVACISEATLESARRFDRNAPSLRPAFMPLRGFSFPLGAELDGAARTLTVRPTLSQYLQNRETETFLSVGTISPRKGYATLLEAFDLHRASGGKSRLLIAGGYGWNTPEFSDRLESHPDRGTHIEWYSDLTDGELEYCYRNVDGLITASYGEGFNLPIVESLRRGKPVLASDLAVHREVAGDHAAYFPAGSADDLAHLLNNPALRTPPSVASPTDFRWPNWKECCREFLHRSASLADRIEDELRTTEFVAVSDAGPGDGYINAYPRIKRQTSSALTRVGIDMIALQSESRDYGIGRYVRNLTKTLFQHSELFEFVLYQYEGYPPLTPPQNVNCTLQTLSGSEPLASEIDRIARQNPDGLDWLVLSSPFEALRGYLAPARSVGGVPIAAVIYDLIPLRYPEWYLADAGTYRRHIGVCQRLAQYDLLLAISDATRNDVAQYLNVALDRIVNISGAVEPNEFAPVASSTPKDTSTLQLQLLGVTDPFVFSMASNGDPRKNIRGLMQAFATLPASIRNARQLVITCTPGSEVTRSLLTRAADLGIQDRLVLTGKVTDQELQALMENCAAFVFPSEYEGFGLPILEAMHCGAPVIAGNNSSQIEVAGDAALLVNVHDPAAIAEAMARVLSDSDLATELRRAGRKQVERFSWERSAALTAEAIVKAKPRHSAHKSRLAVFVPLPPCSSDVADNSFNLLEQLAKYYQIDLFHAPGRPPVSKHADSRFSCWDARTFPRHHRIYNYERILYQMGDSVHHNFVYERLIVSPGVVTLHEYNLAEFHKAYGGLHQDIFWLDREFAYCENGEIPPDDVSEYLRRDLPLNRRVIESSEHIVVQSRWLRDRILARYGDVPISVIPRGASEHPSHVDRKSICRRYNLPESALLIGAFGAVDPAHMAIESIRAFSSIVDHYPDAILLFAGRECDGGEAARYASAVAPRSRIRFLGHLESNDLDDLMSVTDVAVALRRPPMRGETLSRLQTLLRLGVPTLITDVSSFADYPDDVVAKVPPGPEFTIQLATRLAKMCDSKSMRTAMGEAAAQFAVTATWPSVAEQYRVLIEGVVAQRHRQVRAPVRSRAV